MRGAWLLSLGLTACAWSAAVDTYCEETGHCGAAGGGSAGGRGSAGGGGEGTAGGAASAGGGSGGGMAGSTGGDGGGSSGGTPDAGAALGAMCSVKDDCGSGHCVDGRCCDSLCNNSCDACNLPGREGRCEATGLGSQPVPACNGFLACNGVNTACPSSCASDAGCWQARCGSGGVCIPKIATLKEDFDGGLDPLVWTMSDSQSSVVNGQLRITTLPNSPGSAVFTRNRFDLLDSEVRIELINAGNQNLNPFYTGTSVCGFPSFNRCLNILINRNQVTLELGDNGTSTYPWGMMHPLGSKRFFRVRESAGTTFFEAADASGAFTVLGQAATPFRLEWLDVDYEIGAGAFQSTTSTSTAIWDNVNLP